MKAREMDRRAEVADRRLTCAQSRYLQALTALAKVRTFHQAAGTPHSTQYLTNPPS